MCRQTEQHVISIVLLICCHVFASAHGTDEHDLLIFSFVHPGVDAVHTDILMESTPGLPGQEHRKRGSIDELHST